MEVVRGDIFDANGLIAIPVNMVGVAGAGLAKAWKEKYPEYYEQYPKACASFQIREQTTLINWFWMLPTKVHWRDNSDMAFVLNRVKRDLDNIGKNTATERVNLPKVGCGLGGLDWNDMLPRLVPILLDFEETYKIPATVYV